MENPINGQLENESYRNEILPADQRREGYERNNQEAASDKEIYNSYSQVFERALDFPYSKIEPPWKIHYAKGMLDEMSVEQLVGEYEYLTRVAQQDQNYREELAVLTETLIRRVYDDASIACVVEPKEDQEGRRGYRITATLAGREVSVPLSMELSSGEQRNINLIKPLRLLEREAPESWTAHGYVNEYLTPERLQRMFQAGNLEDAYAVLTEYSGNVELTSQFDPSIISSEIERYVDYTAQSEVGSGNLEFTILNSLLKDVEFVRKDAFTLYEERVKKLSSEESLQLNLEVGRALGLMARRDVLPPAGPVLKVLSKISSVPVIKEALEKVTRVESKFWGHKFDPIEDAMVADIYETIFSSVKHLPLRQQMQCADFMSRQMFSLDMTRCNDTTSRDNPVLSGEPIDSEMVNNIGIYFGVLGSYKNWGQNRVIIQGMPLKLVKFSTQYSIVPAVSVRIPQQAISFSRDYRHWIVDGSKLHIERPFDMADKGIKFDTMPRPFFRTFIPKDIIEEFNRYFPGTKIENKTVTILDSNITLPFLIIPEAAKQNPLKLELISEYFDVGNNISFEKRD